MGNDSSCDCIRDSLEKERQEKINSILNNRAPTQIAGPLTRRQLSPFKLEIKTNNTSRRSERKSRIFDQISSRTNLDKAIFIDETPSFDKYSRSREYQSTEDSPRQVIKMKKEIQMNKRKNINQCEFSFENHIPQHEISPAAPLPLGEIQIEYEPWRIEKLEQEVQDIKEIHLKREYSFGGKITERTIEDEEEVDDYIYSKQGKEQRQQYLAQQQNQYINSPKVSIECQSDSSLCNIQSASHSHDYSNKVVETRYSYDYSPDKEIEIRSSDKVISEIVQKNIIEEGPKLAFLLFEKSIHALVQKNKRPWVK